MIEAVADGDTAFAGAILKQVQPESPDNTVATVAGCIVLARKGRAFRSLNALITRQEGEHVLYGSALTLAATTQTWATASDTPVAEIARTALR